MACLFGHKWNGCKCERCEKTRDEQHDWDLCKGKCKRCGKIQAEQHDWDGCKCVRCGKENHKWDLCSGKCVQCGKVQNEQHDWDGGRCKRCGKKPDVTIYRVTTLNNNRANDGTPSGNGRLVSKLWDMFDNLVKNDTSYKKAKSMWPVTIEVYADTIISSELLNAPLKWIASATGDSIDTISTLTGIRLFMTQSEIQWGAEVVGFSVCDYFSRTETANYNSYCPYYKDSKCIAGGQINNCSTNPQCYNDCVVYQYNTTGDVRVLY